MIDALISTALQLVIFAAIPCIFYGWEKRTVKGFLEYIGLKRSNREANLLGLLTGIILLVGPVTLAMVSPDVKAVFIDPGTVTGNFYSMDLGIEAAMLLVLTAVIKIALAEEILFRGFIAKQLIGSFGFKSGNLSQALLFGVLHLLMFLGLSAGWPFAMLIFFVSTAAAWISGYINERLAAGSIIPGWIAHAAGNLITYVLIGFVI